MDDLTLEDFREQSDLFEEDITEVLDMESIVAARKTYGGTGHDAVKEQMILAQQTLTRDEQATA